MEAREIALKSDGAKIEIGASKTVAGTVNAALVSYYKQLSEAGLEESTKQNRRAILERFRADHGDKRIALMHKTALQNIINSKTPAVQRNFKKAMRGFVEYCLNHGLMPTDPVQGVKLAKMKTIGHHTWTVEEIEQYKTRHPAGSKARLALMLLLQTGHARADVVRMGRQHVKNGTLSMRRQKTKVQFDIPLLPDLLTELELHPKAQLAFLATDRGRSFTPAGFGGWFRDRCDEAGLEHCAAHGLRKAAAVWHALNGATAPELMAWFGWRSISEAQRYIEEANRIKLAESAGARIISGTAFVPPADPVGQNETQAVENIGGKK
jgi:integrase